MTSRVALLFATVLSVTLAVAAGACRAAGDAPDGELCLTCHSQTTPGLTSLWQTSKHAEAKVGCGDCHRAQPGSRPDVREHYGQQIAVLVTPKDCGRCHEKESRQFQTSHHAKAAQFIGSLDNVLGEVVGGSPAADTGCRQCHGSTVNVGADGKLDPSTWPNTGIGRVNPDGSAGSCSACHARHGFSIAQARQPENCGRCHLGPDHPQAEIYNESKHGILYRAEQAEMNLELPGGKWVAGRDYSAPTCASCHMGATASQPVTHDVGTRLSWTLRPAISTKLDRADAKRASMQEVCGSCHSSGFVDGFYHQYDSQVQLYNEKFATPAKAIMDQLTAEKLITPTPFDDRVEWTYYLLWHHAGRRARHGAAMGGPDYAWWHGLFEVADEFYNEFLPEAEKLRPGIAEPVLDSELHRWRKGLSREETQRILDFYRGRYGQ